MSQSGVHVFAGECTVTMRVVEVLLCSRCA